MSRTISTRSGKGKSSRKSPAKRKRPALKLLALPPRPELRRVPLWEVLTQERSLYMSLQIALAQSFAATYNSSAPANPAKVVERSALIAETGGAV